MPTQCPTCSKVNPTNAAYCFYDGRALGKSPQNRPSGPGTVRFSLPFSFADGLGCVDYNQLALACDRRWNEARGYLLNGTWASFFNAIGRPDLAALAVQAARETDPDLGLCRFLEGLPADPEALKPAKLALTSTTEDLGELEPGKDYKLDVVIENQGVLLLRGSVTTDCDWLFFGDRQGNTSAKLFQTRDSYTLSVRVMASQPLLADDLEGDDAAQLPVLGLEDSAHAAFAKPFEQDVGTQQQFGAAAQEESVRLGLGQPRTALGQGPGQQANGPTRARSALLPAPQRP
jgi:hypothetical protein